MNGDPFAALLGGGAQQDPTELARQLRGDYRLGTAMQFSADPMFHEPGAAMSQRAYKTAGDIGTLTQARKKAEADRQAREAQTTATAEHRRVMQGMSQQRLDLARLGLTGGGKAKSWETETTAGVPLITARNPGTGELDVRFAHTGELKTPELTKEYNEQWREEAATSTRNLAAQKEMGKMSVKEVPKYQSTIDSIDRQLPIMRDSMALLSKEAIESGESAMSGPAMSKLPSFRNASIQLDAMRDDLALSMVGSVKMGTLSDAEGKWLRDVAIPENMRPHQLREWMENKYEGYRRYRALLQHRVDSVLGTGQLPTREESQAVLKMGGFEFEDPPSVEDIKKDRGEGGKRRVRTPEEQRDYETLKRKREGG